MSLLLLFGGSALPAGIASLVCGYMEVPPEPEFDSYVSQIIENVELTGSGTATESGDTSSGSGSQSTTGTGSPTESADTASGAGTQSLTGSGATTEGADTVSGSGTASTTGSGTATETGDTSSGTGTASTSGSGAITETGDTASGTGSQAGASAVMLRAGYYEVAPERIEVYGAFVSFVAQSTSVDGSGSPTEGGDTSSGAGTAEGDSAYSVEFPDEDWTDYTPDSDVYQVITDPIFDGTGSPTESGDSASGSGSGAKSDEQFTGGFFTHFERERAKREKARRKRLEDEEEAERLQNEIDREIARLLHAQEAQRAEREEMARLTALVAQAAKLRQQEAFNARVLMALDRALQNATVSALLAFEREVQRQMDAEDAAVLLLLLND